MSKKILPFIFGIKGTELTDDERKLFTKYHVKGFILFARNIKNQEQLQKLTQDLKTLYYKKTPLHHVIHNHFKLLDITNDTLDGYKKDKHIPFILIDQEGGRVARLKPPVIKNTYKSAAKLTSINEVAEQYRNIMNDLKSFDIDSPCAPVCDLRHEGAHDVIGDRSFSNDPDQCTFMANIAIQTILSSGGIAIMKHIPGHGRAFVDSHKDLPYINDDFNTLKQTDFAVFTELSKTRSDRLWAMPAHIIFKAIDDNNPITISYKGIQYIRNVIGFKGTLISDDICMNALHQGIIKDTDEYHENLCKIAKAVIDAGQDIVLHCSGNLDEMTNILSSFIHN